MCLAMFFLIKNTGTEHLQILVNFFLRNSTLIFKYNNQVSEIFQCRKFISSNLYYIKFLLQILICQPSTLQHTKFLIYEYVTVTTVRIYQKSDICDFSTNI